MKIVVVEDDLNIIKILEKIVEDRNLGIIVGSATDGISGEQTINELKPDIVLVDLLMPGKDGISLVKDMKITYPDMQFIMISQVSTKEMIGKAYEKGIEYYINKPINATEVENIIRKVTERLNMNRTLTKIQNLFSPENINGGVHKRNDTEYEIKRIMLKLGILGQAGSQDIIDMVYYLFKQNSNMDHYTVKELCSLLSNNPKSMEQRVRRTVFTGMVNLANLGVEDYMNEIFTEYSNSLYNFEQVKKEMDFIRGKSKRRGKVNLKKFIEGMVGFIQH